MGSPRRKKDRQSQVGWPQALSDFMKHATSKGQLLPAAAFVCVLGVIVKLPPEGLSTHVGKIIDHLRDWGFLGWLLSFGLLIGWVAHTRSMRRAWSREMERMAKERNKWQAEVLDKGGKKTESSRGRKR